jgi:hypothetical protein
VDALHIFNAANIHYKSRTEESLLHGGDKIGAAGKNLDSANMLRQISNRLFNAARTQKFE